MAEAFWWPSSGGDISTLLGAGFRPPLLRFSAICIVLSSLFVVWRAVDWTIQGKRQSPRLPQPKALPYSLFCHILFASQFVDHVAAPCHAARRKENSCRKSCAYVTNTRRHFPLKPDETWQTLRVQVETKTPDVVAAFSVKHGITVWIFESVACSLLLYPRSLKQVFGFGAWLGPTILPIDTRVHTKYIPQDASCCLVLCKPITHESQNIYIYIYYNILWLYDTKDPNCRIFFVFCFFSSLFDNLT